MKVQAGSLLYAVYICLLISILSGALLFVFSLRNTFSQRLALNGQLVNQCETCLNFYLGQPEKVKALTTPEVISVFNDGLKCEVSKKEWGALTVLTINAFFKKDTVQKRVFIGEYYTNERPALYLSDLGEVLKISGKTNIEGDVVIPSGRFEKITVLGNSKLNKPQLTGSIGAANRNLPKRIPIENSTYETNTIEEASLAPRLFQSFDKETLIINLDQQNRLDKVSLKGNIVVKSTDTIFIGKESALEDVIIQAPKIVIEEGFAGSAQFIGEKEVEVHKNVTLHYPSSISISTSSTFLDKKIVIGEQSEIYGSIYLDADTFDEKEANRVHIDEETLIVGDVYVNGKMELKGNVIGTVYAHKILLETKSGVYNNVLLNTTLSTRKLPKDFIGLLLLENEEKQIYGVIKQI